MIQPNILIPTVLAYLVNKTYPAIGLRERCLQVANWGKRDDYLKKPSEWYSIEAAYHQFCAHVFLQLYAVLGVIVDIAIRIPDCLWA